MPGVGVRGLAEFTGFRRGSGRRWRWVRLFLGCDGGDGFRGSSGSTGFRGFLASGCGDDGRSLWWKTVWVGVERSELVGW